MSCCYVRICFSSHSHTCLRRHTRQHIVRYWRKPQKKTFVKITDPRPYGNRTVFHIHSPELLKHKTIYKQWFTTRGTGTGHRYTSTYGMDLKSLQNQVVCFPPCAEGTSIQTNLILSYSIGMCRMWRFLAVLGSFFHSPLLYTFSCHPSPPTILPFPHFILPSISWSTSWSCCFQIHIQYSFENSISFHSLYMSKPM
jgi:hypothetical protein